MHRAYHGRVPRAAAVAAISLLLACARHSSASGSRAGGAGETGGHAAAAGTSAQASGASGAAAGTSAQASGAGGSAGSRTPDGGTDAGDALDASSEPPLSLCASASAPPADARLSGRAWSPPDVLRVFAQAQVVRGASIAVDDMGRAAAAWAEYDGALFHVWVARYDEGAGWQAPRQVDPPTPADMPLRDRTAVNTQAVYAGDALEPQVVLLPNGDALVTWTEAVDAGSTLSNEVWISTVGVDGEASAAQSCPCGKQLAVDATGDVLSVWADGAEVKANVYSRAGGWGQPAVLDTLAAGAPSHPPAFALAPAGHALAAWWDLAAMALEVAVRADDGSFAVERAVTAEPTHVLGAAAAGIDDCGDAVLLWQSDELRSHEDALAPSELWIARRENGEWSEPTRFGPEGAGAPVLAVLPNRRALASYGTFGLTHIVRRVSRTRWERNEVPELTPAGFEAAILATGEVLAMAQSELPPKLLAKRFDADGVAPAPAEQAALGWVHDLAINARGQAFAILVDAPQASELRVIRLE